MNSPNFFIIGSVKCGTTSLFSYLQKSPMVFMPYQKEPHYFISCVSDLKYNGPDDSKFFESYPKIISEYERLFSGVKDEVAVGEASTMYMQYIGIAEKLYEYNPDAKIIALIRNPIERAYSHYLHNVREGTSVFSTFNQSLCAEINGEKSGWAPQRLIIETGHYLKHLKQFYESFPKEQILVIKFEDFTSNPNKTLSIVSAFLGIYDCFSDTIVEKHNASGEPKSKILHNTYYSILGIMRRMFPFLKHSPLSVFRKRIDNFYRNRFLIKPQMDDDSRNLLRRIYIAEISDLEELTGLKLSDWFE